jgi:hypothetical protein
MSNFQFFRQLFLFFNVQQPLVFASNAMLQHMWHHHVHRHRRRDIHFELPPRDVLHVGAVKHGLHPTVPRPLHKGTDRTVLVAGLVVQELPSFQPPGEKGKGKTGSKKKRWERNTTSERETHVHLIHCPHSREQIFSYIRLTCFLAKKRRTTLVMVVL